jgi:transposase
MIPPEREDPAMRDPTVSPDRQALARQRAQLIMQVRSGVLTAEAAARQLGVSRKTYYKWERRALAAMVEALEARGQGRPPRPSDPEKAALRRQTEALRAKLTVLEQTERLRQLLAQPEKKNP